MATGDTLAIWEALEGNPPASGYATLDVRNGHVVLDFDDAAEEAIVLGGVYPAHYGGGDLLLELTWAATSATSGNVKWNAAVENTTDTDIDGDAFGTAVSATAATSATSGGLTKTSLTVGASAAGDPLGGEAFRVKITRDADDAADTMSGDAELLAVHLREGS